MKSTTLIALLLLSVISIGICVNAEGRDGLAPRGMRLSPPIVTEMEVEEGDHLASNSSSSSESSSSSDSSDSSDASVISAAPDASSSSSSSDSDSSSDNESASDSASSSDSSSNSDSSSDSSDASNLQSGYLRKFRLFIESASRQEKAKCSKGKYLKKGACLPCSLCGPDLYTREQCSEESDTVCDWCLNVKALKNEDFSIKCFATAKIHREFEQLLRRPHSHSQMPSEQEMEVVFAEKDPSPYVSYTTIREPFSLSKLSPQASWRLEMLVEACFYLVLVTLIVAVIRFISKSKPNYRTITVNPPVLNDADNSNIIRAAENIRHKIGKKGYNHLEEFI